MASSDRLTRLRQQWSALCAHELPRLAGVRDKSQSKWPVTLDHCFARIILDNAVGEDKPWMQRVDAPAVRNMSERQLQADLGLGRAIASGRANLDELNQRSLGMRGKSGPKRKYDEPDREAKRPKTASATEDIRAHFFSDTSARSAIPTPEILQARNTIASPSELTPFRRFALILLTYIPSGRYSTYGAMSAYITANHHKCSARAIGNAMRNNPFAPTVPCLR